ncbi:MAG: HD domain-containing protein [Clostridiales bacterium]|nr:HD domain-containing protein [Clostridiales bacterium]
MLSRDVKTAQEWAERLHQGQVDKSGKPYIGHPARVAGRLQTPEAQVVGWLHDTVEDTGLSLSEVEKEFGIETAKAVDAVSRKDGEDWDAYLLRVKKNPIARQVKISDLIDNSNLSRLDHITIKDVLRQAKYNRALQFLLSENKLD